MSGYLNRIRSDRRGTALVFTLLVTAVLLILATALISVTGSDYGIASAQEQKKVAQYLIESAVEIARDDIKGGNYTLGVRKSGQMTIGNYIGEYYYVIEQALSGVNTFNIRAFGSIKTAGGKKVGAKEILAVYENSPGEGGGGGGNPPVSGVILDKHVLTMTIGGLNDYLTATVLPPEARNKAITWTVDDPAVVSMSTNGLGVAVVSAVGPGTTEITVTTEEGGYTDVCQVTVVAPPESFLPDPEEDEVSHEHSTAFDYAFVGQGNGTNVLQLEGKFGLKNNGTMHANSDIEFINNGREIEAEGTVSSTGSITAYPGGDFNKAIFLENHPQVVMPVVDWVYLKQHADKIFSYPERPINAASDLNGNDIVFIEGDIELVGEPYFDILIVATGNITVKGDFAYPDSNNTAAGLIAGNNIIFIGAPEHNEDDAEIEGPRIKGLVMTFNDLIVRGEAAVEGSLIVGNNIHINTGQLQIVNDEDNRVARILQVFGTEFITNHPANQLPG